jgi:SecD/SecF fusion protein
MQNRGLILVFTILLALTSLYQLSFTWVANKVEQDAYEFAKGDPVLMERYLDSVSTEKVYPLFGFTYEEVKKHELNLGLDLKGGMNVVLEVAVEDVVKGLANNPKDTLLNKVIKKAIEKKKSSNLDFITVFGEVFEKEVPNGRLIQYFYSPQTKDYLSRDASNEEVLAYLRKEANDAIDRTYQVVNIRTSQFGVAQPNIQRLEATDRILVELPGVKNKERVRKLLQGTAKLEFWETYENAEIYPKLAEVNDRLAKILYKSDNKNDSTANENKQATDSLQITGNAVSQDTTGKDTEDDFLKELTGENDGTFTSTDDSLASDTAAAKTFEEFARKNPLFAILRPAIFQNEQGQYTYQEGPVVGYIAIKDTGKLNRYLAMPEVKKILPKNLKLLYTAKPYDEEKKFLQVVAIKVTRRDGKAPLEGDVVVDAVQDFGQFGGKPEVQLKMNPSGANAWKLLTRDNIGKSIAIVLDNHVYSFPTVQTEIAGGISQITGNFTIEEAQDLANILKSGKLPAPARIVQEAVVGPSLGKESIQAGLTSFIIALLLVFAYMIFYYSKAGLISDVALIANIFFILGALASTSLALTLPGIAGIVLTVGMSVDANVLIYERIREELSSGKSLRLAIEEGYKNAYSSILDSNITTLLTGIVLWVFGTGPIEGFATTLVIGILTSLFSAIFITRLIISYQLDKNKSIDFYTKFTQNLFQNINIDFLGKRKIFYGISSTIILIGIVSLVVRGLYLGVDFKGGRTYVIRFDKVLPTTEIVNALKTTLVDDKGNTYVPEVKTYGTPNTVKITTAFLIDSDDENADNIAEEKIKEGLNKLNAIYEILETQKVGPTIADDIKTAAFWSVIFSLLIIFVYILFRFKKWQFGVGATVALFHDVLIVLSIYSLFYGLLPFSLEIDQAFIAAILTVVGYSINDTVVVFDRIREYLGLPSYKKVPFDQTINASLNATLSRTINTSMTTLLVLLIIFIFGGVVIRGFIFAILIGILVGTYSSLFIATPLVYDLSKHLEENQNRK